MTKADRTALLKLRMEIDITVEGERGCEFPPVVLFSELEGVVPDYSMQAILDSGLDAPLPVQAQALPLVLSGHDLIGIAKPGSGKTLAYLLPAIVHIEAQQPLERLAATPIALVLAPVRELVAQITVEAQRLIRNSQVGNHGPRGLRAVSICGGPNEALQVAALKVGSHIVVATPGRLTDVIDALGINLERVTYFVLDEADRMLELGLEDAVRTISGGIRRDRHTLLFSAAWTEVVQDLAQLVFNPRRQPVTVTHNQKERGSGTGTLDDIVQEIEVFDDKAWEDRDARKQEWLYAHVREVLEWDDHKVLVFVSRKDLADRVCRTLGEEGFRTESLHGGRGEHRRLGILEDFRRGEIQLLVATDVVDRGLDIPGVSHVVLYDMSEIDDYLHRIGRASRGSYGPGRALTLFEYERTWPHLAGQLIDVLEESNQKVPEELREIAHQVANGLREAKWHTPGR